LRAVSEPPQYAPDAGFAGFLGMRDFAREEDGTLRAVVPVRPELLQPFGLVHGGVYAAIAETLASIGTFLGVQDQGLLAMGLSNSTSFLRPITSGTIHAVARPLHQGGTTWLWDVSCSDDQDRVCALTRATIAVRPPRES
jgi:1,4-dihydroxy-2-naphthoyl-CoA hydrolase